MTAMGTADDLGRAGRSLQHRCDAVSSQTQSPWPGSFYSFPLAIVVLAGALAAADLLAFDCRPLWWSVFGWGLLVSAPIWLGVLVWSALTIVSPGSPPAETGKAQADRRPTTVP